jgi:1,4-alpha-glucan branching enzyme
MMPARIAEADLSFPFCHAMIMYMPKTLALFLSLLVLSGCATAVRRPEGGVVSVRFTCHAPSAVNVSLVGSFNQWEPGSHPLHGPDGDGVWTIVLPLPSGRHEYRFVVNDVDWIQDPGAPSVDDGMGGTNSLVIVGP